MAKPKALPLPSAELIGAVYDAALDASVWALVLKSVCDVVNAPYSLLFSVTPPLGATNGLTVGHDFDPSHGKLYASHFQHVDPWRKSAKLKNSRQGWIYTGDDLVARRDFERSEFLNDGLKDTGKFHMAGFVVHDGSQVPVPRIHFGAYRWRNQGEFGSEWVNLIARIGPHLQRAVSLRWRLLLAETDRRAALATLDQLAAGVILVDAQGQSIHANTAAQAMLRARDGLALVNGHLAGAIPDTTARLAKVIGAAAGTFSHGTGSSGGALPLPRPSGKASYLVTVSPLAPENPLTDGPRRVAAVVFIDDPEAEVRTPPDVLKALFGLTAAESRVALAWANGERAEDISGAHGTTLETVRSQIRSIHDKLGVSRQAQASKRIVKATGFVKREEQ